jgi:peptidoglycan/xylan/chitin deacetylase (PgdA/CDA1 family)
MKRAIGKVPDWIRILASYVILLSITGTLCFLILRYYGPEKISISETYISPFPHYNEAQLNISQNSGNQFPPLNPAEKPFIVPILMYHYISSSPWKDDKIRIGLSTPPFIFERQLKQLSDDGYTTITLNEMFDAFAGRISLPEKPVILTFDDGYADFYQNAFPLLKKYSMKGTVFVITSFVDKLGYLTWPQINEMDGSGIIQIGSHTIHHLALTLVKPEILKQEVEESKLILENHLGHPVMWFAYPYGIYNKKVVDAVQKAGYFGAVNTIPGKLQYEGRLFYLTRYRAGTKTDGDLLTLVK